MASKPAASDSKAEMPEMVKVANPEEVLAAAFAPVVAAARVEVATDEVATWLKLVVPYCAHANSVIFEGRPRWQAQ